LTTLVPASPAGKKKASVVGVGLARAARNGTCLPCRRGDFANCRNAKILRNQLRWRLSGIHDRSRGSACRNAGEPRRPWKPDRCFCAGSHHLQRSAPQRRLAFRPRCRPRQSAASGISEFSLPINLDTESPPSAAVSQKSCSRQENSALTSTLTAKPPMPPKSSRKLGGAPRDSGHCHGLEIHVRTRRRSRLERNAAGCRRRDRARLKHRHFNLS